MKLPPLTNLPHLGFQSSTSPGNLGVMCKYGTTYLRLSPSEHSLHIVEDLNKSELLAVTFQMIFQMLSDLGFIQCIWKRFRSTKYFIIIWQQEQNIVIAGLTKAPRIGHDIATP